MRWIVALVVTLFVTGCGSAHIITGNTRQPTDPRQIKLFFAPPKRFETIAVISSDSNGSFTFSMQARVDKAMERAKKEAAELGANGLLFQSLGDGGSVMVGNGMSTGSSSTFVGASSSGAVKTVSALAIYVFEE